LIDSYSEKQMKCIVTGAGGFIGGHLVTNLLYQGFQVRAIDVKPFNDWFQLHPEAENLICDLQNLVDARKIINNADRLYHLAADMGGIGYIQNNQVTCMLNVLSTTHTLLCSAESGISQFFFASSACVYNTSLQSHFGDVYLKERDAYPALPEDGYGWEKLYGERLAEAFRLDYSINVRIARFHNIYGPHGHFRGGREKAPAALCRKVAEAKLSGRKEIEIWGNGQQRRSFTFIDDCIVGTQLLMEKPSPGPINIGSSEGVTINELVTLIEEIAGMKVVRRFNETMPIGVFSRNSDNTLARDLLGWEPRISLSTGLESTYRWIYDSLSKEFN
jgi:GDP-D-mannose 3',5'-epimerase